MVQEELSLSGHRIESIDHLFQPHANKMCRSCFESYKRIDELDAMLLNNIRTVLTSTDCSFSDRRNESHPAIIVGSHSTPVAVRPYIEIVIVYLPLFYTMCFIDNKCFHSRFVNVG